MTKADNCWDIQMGVKNMQCDSVKPEENHGKAQCTNK